jgi:hypothetical protein
MSGVTAVFTDGSLRRACPANMKHGNARSIAVTDTAALAKDKKGQAHKQPHAPEPSGWPGRDGGFGKMPSQELTALATAANVVHPVANMRDAGYRLDLAPTGVQAHPSAL